MTDLAASSAFSLDDAQAAMKTASRHRYIPRCARDSRPLKRTRIFDKDGETRVTHGIASTIARAALLAPASAVTHGVLVSKRP